MSGLVGLLALELGCRLHRGTDWLMAWDNLAARQQNEEAETTRVLARSDPLLGTRPNPKVDRLILPGADGPPVLATGDSYTYGEDVDRLDSWPAILQGILHRPVLNGGVSAYGLDQTVLRTEVLAESHRPTAIVVSFIADDIWRLDMARVWGRNKPFFTLAGDGSLVLHPATFLPAQLSIWQRALGWSVLLQTVIGRLSWHDEWTSDDVRALPAGTGERLVCPLMRRLAGIGVPTLVVVQYEPTIWRKGDATYNANQIRLSRLVEDCAGKAGLATFDTYDVVEAGVRRDGLTAIYGPQHHTPDGNRLIADAVASELAKRNMLTK